MATKTSTAVAVKKTGGNIVSIRDKLKALALQTADRTEATSGITIRISQNKEFSLPDGNKTRDPIDVVVVDYTCKNVYYDKPFDSKNIVPPNCFAIGNDPKTLAPSPNAPEPQAKSCAVCPMNEFKSAANGRGKACSNTRMLAVTPPNIKRDKAGKPVDDDLPLWLISASPTAYKGFDGYVQEVARVFELPPIGVITTIGTNPGVDYPSLVFGNPMPNPDIEDHFDLMDKAKSLLAQEPDVSKFEKKVPVKGRR